MPNEKKKPAPPRLVVLMHPWQAEQYDSDSTHYRFEILRVEPEDEKPRNCSNNDWAYPGTAVFNDLEISCYISWHTGKFQAESFSVQYRGHMILDHLDELNRMAKGLKKAAAIQKDFPIRPQTFGQYVTLMASGFGVKEMCRPTRKTTYYTDATWQYLPLSYLQGFIDEEIEKLRKLKIEGIIPPAEEVA